MSAGTFLCALAVATLAGAGGFAYGFITGCRYGGFAYGGQVPDQAKREDRPE